MKTLSKNQMEESFGGIFWGRDCYMVGDTVTFDDVNCFIDTRCDYYVFWIRYKSIEFEGAYHPCPPR